MADDYYKILGVKRSASAADIQKAYRDLARKHHPDMNPDDARAKEQFQRVQNAYDVLGDEEKRAKYDQFGANFEAVQGGGPRSAHAADFENADFSQFFGDQPGGGFADFFSQFSGGGPRQRTAPPRRGADVRHDLRIPFQTAVVGGEARLVVRRRGANTETISVKIPAGINDGRKIRLRGQGEPSPRGGPPGDLLITVHVEPHEFFRRSGKNLEVTVEVTVAEAALGGKIDVPTPKGVISLTIPPGSSSGRRLRIKGHGVQPAGETAGDLYAVLQIVLPPETDQRSAELIRQLDELQAMHPRSNLHW